MKNYVLKGTASVPNGTAPSLELREKVQSFTRIPKLSRSGDRTCAVLTSALSALADAGITRVPEMTGVIDFGKAGAGEENRRYWQDYVHYGKTGAQGHLFVETLPSTPASALAIALHVYGPVLYYDPAGTADEAEEMALSLAEEYDLSAFFLVSSDGENVTAQYFSGEES